MNEVEKLAAKVQAISLWNEWKQEQNQEGSECWTYIHQVTLNMTLHVCFIFLIDRKI